jgi:ubiquinone/menaquinone biosynthesis C-methylase UbiE
MTSIIDWAQLRQNALLSTQRIEMYNPSYWDKEACAVNKNISQCVKLTKKQLKKLPLSPDITVLDVGAGTGRVTLPMAKRVKHVTALEPSEKMLAILRENAKKQQIFNVSYVNKSLEEIEEAATYDLVVASFSLFMLDIKGALLKMNALASKGVYLFMSASPWIDEELQRVINGNVTSWSDFIFIYNILYNTDIAANVETWDYEFKQNFADLDSAVLKFSQNYRIPHDREDNLRSFLRANLVEEKDQLWYNRKRKAAVIWWIKSK